MINKAREDKQARDEADKIDKDERKNTMKEMMAKAKAEKEA